MGLLDILTGNDPAASPWGALFQNPADLEAKKKAAASDLLASMGVSPTNLPQVSPFGDPSKLSAVPAPPMPAPSPFTSGAPVAPFGFASPTLASVNPSQLAPPPAAPVAAAPPVSAPTSLPQTVANANASDDQNDPLAVGKYQMPRIGAGFPDEGEDAPTQSAPASPAAAPAPGAPSAAPMSLAGSGPGFGGRLQAGLQSIQHTSGLIPGIINGISGLTTGQVQRNDPAGAALQQQGAADSATARALAAKNVDPATVQAAIAAARAGQPDLLKTLIAQNFGPDKFQHVTRKDQFGGEEIGSFDPTTGKTTFGGGPAPSGLGDMSKTGADYLATVPTQQAQIIKGMVDGTIQPPSSFALAKPVWQAMLAGAKNLDPSFDENTWAARHKMTTDMAASGNSSMGGILANGKSSFKHLAEYTQSAADLGNASHDFPLGGMIAHGQNYIGNTLGGSDTNAKIKAINDNLGHYGQESTKFYSGTGGGVEERMNALKEMNPTTTSAAEMAAYAEKEKSLMLDRLREKEAQIRNTMGEAYLQQHPVFSPELQKDIARIDANVAQLRGRGAAAAASPGAVPALPAGWSVKVN